MPPLALVGDSPLSRAELTLSLSSGGSSKQRSLSLRLKPLQVSVYGRKAWRGTAHLTFLVRKEAEATPRHLSKEESTCPHVARPSRTKRRRFADSSSRRPAVPGLLAGHRQEERAAGTRQGPSTLWTTGKEKPHEVKEDDPGEEKLL